MSRTTPDLYLSPNQQDLLLAALNSNRPNSSPKANMTSTSALKGERKSSAPTTALPNSGRLSTVDDSPFNDSFGNDDESYNFDDSELFGDLPEESPEAEEDAYTHLHDKRKSLDAADEDDEGGGKRQEGEDKMAKKPGRKPLTSEPTTKRKAQNRAAQRAFRERKEKHLKDLETKVDDLEKASEAANNENGVLKAQIERLTVELDEYRKRLSWINAQAPARQQSLAAPSRNSVFNTGTSDFQFQFPKFGDAPFTGMFASTAPLSSSSATPNSRPTQRSQTGQTPVSANLSDMNNQRHSFSSNLASTNQRSSSMSASPANNLIASPQTYSLPNPTVSPTQPPSNLDNFNGLFSPSIFAAAANPDGNYFGFDVNGNNVFASNRNTSRGSFDAAQSALPGLYFGSSASNTESPGSSHESHQHSSIGASPDTAFTSPTSKLQDLGINTIPDQQNLLSTTSIWNGANELTSGADKNGMNWLPQQQNFNNFDPVLFGDYREAQENLLNQDFGSFFNDAYPLPELGSPTHNYSNIAAQSPEISKKPNLVQSADTSNGADATRPAEAPKLLTCNKIWDRLQSMEKFRNGEIDIDNLCSELRAKAKCSEGGAAVDEHHVNRILGLQ